MKVYELTTGGWAMMVSDLLETPPIETGEWQSMNTAGSKAHMTHELEDVTVHIDQIPDTPDALRLSLSPEPSMPWAEDHFLERVSGIPHNPPASALSWPYAVRGNGDHTNYRGQYDHTYPERFWPKYADRFHSATTDVARRGIRFAYGDLSDVVDLLITHPMTRQAYLPIFFPEDTGGQIDQHKRVPCTLGYHFMIRRGRLTIRYYIRSCDIYRHFTNDVYLACRLAQWVVDEFNTRLAQDPPGVLYQPLELGGMIMHITSLHSFVGDSAKMKDRLNAPQP